MPITSPHSKQPALAAFGSTVRAARIAAAMSQEELALRSGIDRSYLGAIERGDQNPGLLHLVRIAEAIGSTVHELMKDAEL